jgi:Flp pilus assembly protein TadG
MMLIRLLRSRRGVTALEFGMIAPALILLTFGIVESGMLFWANVGLETAAALAARCGATGYTWGTTSCTSASTTQTYALSAVTSLLGSTSLTTGNVTVTSAATSCNALSGKFFTVTISYPYWASLPAPFNNYSLSVTACYAQA